MGAWKRCCAEAIKTRALLESDHSGGDGDVSQQKVGSADGHAMFKLHQREEALGELEALEALAAAPPPRPAAMALMLRRIFPLPAQSRPLNPAMDLAIGL